VATPKIALDADPRRRSPFEPDEEVHGDAIVDIPSTNRPRGIIDART